MKSNVLKFPVTAPQTHIAKDNVKTPEQVASEQMISSRKGVQFLAYEDWVEYIKALGVTSRADWLRYLDANEIPSFLPVSPSLFYGRRKLWKGWGVLTPDAPVVHQSKEKDIHSRGGVFASYETASEYAKAAGISTMAEWVEYHQKNEKPKNIPSDPRSFYTRKDNWKSWNHFLGNEEPYDYHQKGALQKVKRWFKENNITTSTQFFELAANKQLPDFVPAAPTMMYGIKFKDLVAKRQKYLTFQKARAEVLKWNCSSMLEFRAKHREFKASGSELATQIPSAPDRVYKELWNGWTHFLQG
ncbi:hypothetical protein ACROAH_15400 [Shewanella oncorhynchi]|uniref:hypothetical protein n=1 Tax=Shewanella TaxID=22 RepID=UPI0039B006B7